MQACRFGPTTSPAHAHLSIVQNRHIYLFLHSISNVLAQRSHKLHGRLHIACVGTMQGPKFSNCKLAARFFTKQPANSTLFCRLNLAPKPNLSTAWSQNASTLWSTCSRCPGHSSSGDSSNCFNDSSEPTGFLPQTRIDKQQQQIEQAGGNANHKAHTRCRTADNSQQCVHYK